MMREGIIICYNHNVCELDWHLRRLERLNCDRISCSHNRIQFRVAASVFRHGGTRWRKLPMGNASTNKIPIWFSPEQFNQIECLTDYWPIGS